MICPVCGFENKEDVRFCRNCGTLLPTPEVLKRQKRADRFLAVAKLMGVIGLYLGVMFAVTFAWTVKFVFLTGKTFTEAELMEAFNRDSGYVNIIFSGICVLIAAIFYKIRRRSLVDAANICPVPPFKAGTALVCGFAAQLPLGFLVGLIPFPKEVLQGHEELINASTTPMPVQVFYVIVLAPVIEEIFFRGIAHDRLARTMPPIVASLLSSTAFALIHGELIAIIAALIAGLLLSIVYNRYRSVLITIAVHMGFNSCAYIVLLIESPALQITAICVSAVIFVAGLFILLRKDKSVMP